MEGILVISLESGMLLYQEALRYNYGLDGEEVDALQLSSNLFALFKLSCGDNDDSESVNWIKMHSKSVVCFHRSRTEYALHDDINEVTHLSDVPDLLFAVISSVKMNAKAVQRFAAILSRNYIHNKLHEMRPFHKTTDQAVQREIQSILMKELMYYLNKTLAAYKLNRNGRRVLCMYSRENLSSGLFLPENYPFICQRVPTSSSDERNNNRFQRWLIKQWELNELNLKLTLKIPKNKAQARPQPPLPINNLAPEIQKSPKPTSQKSSGNESSSAPSVVVREPSKHSKSLLRYFSCWSSSSNLKQDNHTNKESSLRLKSSAPGLSKENLPRDKQKSYRQANGQVNENKSIESSAREESSQSDISSIQSMMSERSINGAVLKTPFIQHTANTRIKILKTEMFDEQAKNDSPKFSQGSSSQNVVTFNAKNSSVVECEESRNFCVSSIVDNRDLKDLVANIENIRLSHYRTCYGMSVRDPSNLKELAEIIQIQCELTPLVPDRQNNSISISFAEKPGIQFARSYQKITEKQRLEKLQEIKAHALEGIRDVRHNRSPPIAGGDAIRTLSISVAKNRILDVVFFVAVEIFGTVVVMSNKPSDYSNVGEKAAQHNRRVNSSPNSTTVDMENESENDDFAGVNTHQHQPSHRKSDIECKSPPEWVLPKLSKQQRKDAQTFSHFLETCTRMKVSVQGFKVLVTDEIVGES